MGLLTFVVRKYPNVESQITRKEFEAQTKMLKRILDIVEGFAASGDFMAKEIWDKSDIKRYLNISDSTIDRCTKEKIFRPFLVGKRSRYFRDDILPLRDNFLK